MIHTAYIGLGSNMGDKVYNLNRALECMEEKGIIPEAVSSIYETEPQGLRDQPWFLNLAARIKTILSARSLLKVLLSIEDYMGRERPMRWGPRVIDLDILLYENEVIREKDLHIPHPRLTERAFVLIPLLELDPEMSLPDGTLLKEYLTLPDVKSQNVKLYQRT